VRRSLYCALKSFALLAKVLQVSRKTLSVIHIYNRYQELGQNQLKQFLLLAVPALPQFV
jgi:hypothetical protein